MHDGIVAVSRQRTPSRRRPARDLWDPQAQEHTAEVTLVVE
jgi:hypothetical protein